MSSICDMYVLKTTHVYPIFVILYTSAVHMCMSAYVKPLIADTNVPHTELYSCSFRLTRDWGRGNSICEYDGELVTDSALFGPFQRLSIMWRFL